MDAEAPPVDPRASSPNEGNERATPASPGVVLAATFTADPLCESLSLLLREAGLASSVEVSPYGQLFQQLLDPSSGFALNRRGVNVVLIRFEDWWRGSNGRVDLLAADRSVVERNTTDLAQALRTAAAAGATPAVLCICPPSAAIAADAATRAFLDALAGRLQAAVADTSGIRVLPMQWAATWKAEDLHDPEGDRLGHVPYSRRFFAVLGREIARLVHALKNPPVKVIVLDCDNTLWGGVVGEDGTDGIKLTSRHLDLQRLMLEKKQAGMLLCLDSKNSEADVLDVFEQRQDMVLHLDDIVALRVNWLPKSGNIRALASELNLGLDSFAFIDDSPVECAEVEANCPGVLVLRLDEDQDPAQFLGNVWPLDVLDVTDEDRRRSEMVRQNLARDRFAKSAEDLSSFLAGLDLRVVFAEPTAEQLTRVAQLTQRTNQFNFTTQRWSEPEIEQLARQSKECRVVEVSDRFGDYGLVGVIIFSVAQKDLRVDTFLLSCRVLGRGVEHAIMRELGTLAKERGLERIELPFLPSKKNLPARRFLESLKTQASDAPDGSTRFMLPVERACALAHEPEGAVAESAAETPQSPTQPPQDGLSRSQRWNRLARMLGDEENLLASLDLEGRHARTSTELPALPKSETERKLCAIWSEVLGLAEVGIYDDYGADLGGTSLLAVSLFARIERELGVHLPLSVLVETPTIAGIAARIDSPSEQQSLVLLNAGAGTTPLFLVHDADGETLLYRNLARRLDDRPVYGIQPKARPDTPVVHTRIRDMAAHYVAEIRKRHPRGPYLLGGLCAGGVVAYEMALQLEDMGEAARLVAVFDAADVEAERRPNLDNRRRLERMSQVWGQGSALPLARTLATKLGGYVAYQLQHRLRHVRDLAAVTSLRFCLDRGFAPPRWARALDVRSVYNVAEAEYRPSRPLRDEIVLFRASEGEGSEEPYTRLYLDPMLGWGKRSQGGTRAFDVPGGHGSMLQEPHVAAVAEILRSYLASAGVARASAGGVAA